MLETPPATTFADANLALAEALWHRGSVDPAIDALDRAQTNGLRTAPEALLLRARTLVQARQYQPAHAVLQSYAQHCSDLGAEAVSRAETWLQRLDSSEKHALLVAIGQYANPKLPRAKGAANDARAVRRLLVDRCGFRTEDIVLLHNEQASRDAIVHALESLAGYARNLPAFFYFSGLGSVDADGLPMLLAADARQEGVDDLALTQLQQLAAAGGDNLVSLIDAGFTAKAADPRSVDPAPGGGFWYWGQPNVVERQLSDRYRVGGLSIFPASLRYIRGGSKQDQRVTYEFIERCIGGDATAPSRSALRAGLLEAKLTVLGGLEEQPLFANLNAIAQIEAQLTDMERRPLNNAEELLEKLLHRRLGADWQVLLELGAVRYLLDHPKPALEALQEATRLLESADMTMVDVQRAKVDAHYYAAYNFLGQRQYANAVSQFELALAGDPQHAKAHLYHGQALQKLIELDLYQQIEQTWTAFLKLGAPLGHESEIRDFVDKRHPQDA